MTTVLCDGKYLLTDHRLTTRAGSECRIAITKGREDSLAFLSDSRAKIYLPRAGVDIISENKRVMAIACSGGGSEIAKLIDFIDFLRPGAYRLSVLVNKIYKLCSLQKLAGVMLMLDNGSCVSVVFNGVNKPETTNLRHGELAMSGSGSRILRALNRFLPKDTTLEDKFFLCAATDKFTSPSYSVYSLERNELFVSVVPSIKDVKSRADALLKSVNLVQNNIKLYAAVVDN